MLNQSSKTEHGVEFVAAGTPFHLPELPEADTAGEPATRFAVALEAINGLHQQTELVQRDEHLSDLGKATKLKTARDRVLDQVAMQVEGLDSYEEQLTRREAELLKVPEIHPQNAAEAIIDRELRDYWRGLDIKGRHALLDAMDNGPEHQRLEIALLRSPYAQVDHEMRVVRESWNRGKRLENPAEAFAIEAGRQQIDWGRRGMAHLAAITLRTAKYQGNEALTGLLAAGRERAAKSFGFDQQQIEAVKRSMPKAA